jgi:hypothetical protein
MEFAFTLGGAMAFAIELVVSIGGARTVVVPTMEFAFRIGGAIAFALLELVVSIGGARTVVVPMEFAFRIGGAIAFALELVISIGGARTVVVPMEFAFICPCVLVLRLRDWSTSVALMIALPLRNLMQFCRLSISFSLLLLSDALPSSCC